MCAEKFPLVSMGGRAEGLACADPGARTPIGASGNLNSTHIFVCGLVCHNFMFSYIVKRDSPITNEGLKGFVGNGIVLF